MELSKYNNILEDCRLETVNSNTLEKELIKHKLRFPQERVDEVENFRFNPFVYSFYEMLLKKHRIPYQSKFADYYIDKSLEEIKFKTLYDKDDNKQAIRARLNRCFPSYVRDIHFAYKCKESKLFDKVIYNVDLDVKEGIDLVILQDNKYYGIHLFVETERANFWRAKKDKRHEYRNKEVIHLDFTTSKADGKKCGTFFLYSDEQVQDLKKMILENIVLNQKTPN